MADEKVLTGHTVCPLPETPPDAHRLRGPRKEDIDAWFSWFRHRFTIIPGEEGDRSLAEYLNRAIDRQVSKAAGLLTYNALIISIGGQSLRGNDGGDIRNIPLFIASLLSLLSSGILLSMLFTQWGRPSEYRTNLSAASSLFITECNRVRQLWAAASLSSLATLSTLIWIVASAWSGL